MKQDSTDHYSWKRTLHGWGIILFLCLLGAVAALGVRALLESVGGPKHTRDEPVDVPPSSVFPQHEQKRQGLERRNRILLEDGE